MSNIGDVGTELLYASTAAGTAKDTFTSEVRINDVAGMGVQVAIPARFWQANQSPSGISRGIRIVARGIVSSTGTPSYTFTIRGGAAGATSGSILLGSAALPTASGISNAPWTLEGDIILEALSASGGAGATIRGIGTLLTDGYSAATTTRMYPLFGGAASPGTSNTFNPDIVNFINFNITCSASSGSNTITLQQLLVYGLN
jgi:hypothetical protein